MMRQDLIERECALPAFGLWGADALCMKTAAGSLMRALVKFLYARDASPAELVCTIGRFLEVRFPQSF